MTTTTIIASTDPVYQQDPDARGGNVGAGEARVAAVGATTNYVYFAATATVIGSTAPITVVISCAGSPDKVNWTDIGQLTLSGNGPSISNSTQPYVDEGMNYQYYSAAVVFASPTSVSVVCTATY